jgi:hypothetical protein
MISYDNPKNLIKNTCRTSDLEAGRRVPAACSRQKSQTGKLGIVISAADTNWYKQSGGFVAGARSVNPDVVLLRPGLGPPMTTTPWRKRVMQAIASGADHLRHGRRRDARLPGRRDVEEGLVHIGVIGDPPRRQEGRRALVRAVGLQQGLQAGDADINAGTYG